MVTQKASVTVIQHHNPRFDSNKPVELGNEIYIYEVVKCVNTLAVTINEWLVRDRMHDLMQQDITVIIQGPCAKKQRKL